MTSKRELRVNIGLQTQQDLATIIRHLKSRHGDTPTSAEIVRRSLFRYAQQIELIT